MVYCKDRSVNVVVNVNMNVKATDLPTTKKQAVLRRRRNRPANIFFGSQFDAFQALPQLPMEAKTPGILNEIKHNGEPPADVAALRSSSLSLRGLPVESQCFWDAPMLGENML